MSELIDTGSGVTPRRTNRPPLGSPGTDMGSGMMGDPTMGNPMFGRTMMPGYGFMSELIDTGSGVTPRRTNRPPLGSPGTDMGSGMMGDPTNLGGGSILDGIMGGVEYADSALSAYTNNNLNMKIVQGPMSSVIDLSNNPTSVRILNEKEKIKSIQPSNVSSVSSKYNSLYNRVTNNIVNNPESFQNSLFSQQTQFLTNNAVLGNDVYTQMLRESRVLPESLTNTFAPLPTRFSQAQNIDMTTQMYGAREPYSPVNQFSNLNISTYPQTNQLSETNQTISYPMNSFGTISPANYYTSPQSITGGSYTSVPVNSYHRR